MRLRKELAVRLYEKRLLGFGKARQLAQMPKWEFQRLLGEENILRSYDSEELEKDMKSLQEALLTVAVDGVRLSIADGHHRSNQNSTADIPQV